MVCLSQIRCYSQAVENKSGVKNHTKEYSRHCVARAWDNTKADTKPNNRSVTNSSPSELPRK